MMTEIKIFVTNFVLQVWTSKPNIKYKLELTFNDNKSVLLVWSLHSVGLQSTFPNLELVRKLFLKKGTELVGGVSDNIIEATPA